ncbi:MAG: UDP-N-acetylmuramoyl-tripeptide--D-alanyl-D-alanine ligase [Caldilineaceae bacterium]|nr:UDP-N-acetylmuramoyl-tripeptide--D-alanyl-D-alanine ligase [Caldilineaceae bacterium]
MAERPVVETVITHHTVWHALTGDVPPLSLPAAGITPAVLDSRDVRPGSLFAAFVGEQTDGHRYIGQALEKGAAVVICEERGLEFLGDQSVQVIRCQDRADNWTMPQAVSLALPLVYVVESTLEAIQRLGGFQRLHRCRADLRVVGITGSVGKTSTKELTETILSQRYATYKNPGNLNSDQGLPLALLGLGADKERAVLEMGMYQMGEINRLCQLARPSVGVVTNVGPSHLSRLGTIERIAQAKAELVEALPAADDGGVAVLNWDDERVRPMAGMTRARIFSYGLTPEADLWADEIESAGMEGIRFRFHHNVGQGKTDNLYVKVPLLGRHSVHTALRAAAVGLVEGLTWQEIAAGLQRSTGQLRLVLASGINGSTLIDDTYNASPSSTMAALNLLEDLRNGSGRRRVAVLGDMRELGDFTEEGHRQVGIRAAATSEILVTVGSLGQIIGTEALNAGFPPDNLYMFENADDAIEKLRRLVQPNDLVLIKGSRAVGMDRVVTEISQQSNER